MYRYFVAADELQATFPGAEQRQGVFILPLVVPKLFAVKAPDDDSDEEEDAGAPSRRGVAKGGAGSTAAARPSHHASTRDTPKPATATPGIGTGEGNGAATFTFEEGDETDDDMPADFLFDWDLYHEVWGETPYEDAVTAMFAEYAVLYSRIGHWTTTSAPPTMTVNEAKSISEHASSFIQNYVRPILGDVNTPKVHKLLRHILGAIQMHGRLSNCNTSLNEANHKVDKRFYRRANKVAETFTAQLARQSQGTQAVLASNAVKDAAAIRADKLRRQRRSMARGGQLTADTKRSVQKLLRVPVGAIAQRPGLLRLSYVLALDPNDKVPVLNQVTFLATLECGTRLRQVLYSSMSFRGKGKRFDSVIYTVDADMPVIGRDGMPHTRLHYGDVRALLRYKEEDVAVICNMEEVRADKDCPLAERGCKRLKWAVPLPGMGDWSVSAVPLSRVRRVIHVAPDFAELSSRRGVKAMPAGHTASLGDSRAMRYFENPFYPWE